MIITKDDREIELMTEAGRIVALVHEMEILFQLMLEHVTKDIMVTVLGLMQ